MKKLLLVPALLFTACADSPTNDQDSQANGVEDDAPAPADTPAPTPENPFSAGFTTEPNDCADHSIRLMAHWGYADGTRPEDVICRFTLSDGTVLGDSCFAVPSIEVGQNVTLTVVDPATGASGSDTQFVQGPASFTVTADVTSDGLSISWDAHSHYGMGTDQLPVDVTITPSEKVIVPDPSVLNQFAGTVNVTEAGTYTVTVHSVISFANVGGCGAAVTRTLELTCDGTMH